jgi:hypothetical protein
MDKERLISYCMLPVATIDVAPKPNRTYWQWCDVNGKRPEGVPQNRRGVWRHFVDIKHGDGPIQTFGLDGCQDFATGAGLNLRESGESGITKEAWEQLFETAVKNGYKETGELYAYTYEFNIGTNEQVEITCRQLENNYELTISYKGSNKAKFIMNLDKQDVLGLKNMLSEVVE